MPFQTVIEYDLALFHIAPRYCDFCEAHRQLIEPFAALKPGTMVRLHVHRYSPSESYLGFMRRSDIRLQIVAADSAVAEEWTRFLSV